MIEKLLISGLALMVGYFTWFWGGLKLAWLPPAVWASCLLLVALLVLSLAPMRTSVSRSHPWWQDPFFYFGFLFLSYLAIQWGNAGRILYFDVGFQEWRYSPPPHPGWPSAFSTAEAAQMLYWFFPAWVLGLIVRSQIVGRSALTRLLRGLVFSAGLLALFGVVQFLTRTPFQYWLAPNEEGFFASFGYTNHAAAYFVLMGALAAGLLFREIFRSNAFTVDRDLRARSVHTGLSLVPNAARRSASTQKIRIGTLAASLLLCLVGANLSLSRAGVILAWALAAFIALFGLIRGWKRLHAAGRLNLAVATVAVLFVFYFAVAGFGSKDISREFTAKKPLHHLLFPVLDNINLSFGGRAELDEAAWRMWEDHKLLGIGGWGYRYMLALYIPKEKWNTVVLNSGKANVHCDVLQFLAEFGIVGFGLMLATGLALIGSLLRPIRHSQKERSSPVVTGVSPVNAARTGGYQRREEKEMSRHDPLWIMSIIGLSLVLIFSLIDLPFRCPAILCTWIIILAALPKVTAVLPNNR